MAFDPSNDDESRQAIEGYHGARFPMDQRRYAPGPAPVVPSATIDIKTLWQALRDGWPFVARIGLAMLLVVLAGTLLMRMNFNATGRLYLGELEDKGKGSAPSGGLDILGSSAGEVASEIEIMKSRSLIYQAIASSGLNATLAPADWSSPRFWKWLLFRRDPSLIRGAAGELSVSDATLSETARKAQTFQLRFATSTAFKVYQDDEYVGEGTLGSPTVVPMATFTLHPGDRGTPSSGEAYEIEVSSVEEIAKRVLKDLSVSAPKLSASSSDQVKVVTLDFVHRNPIQGATFLRELMRVYLEERQAWKIADASAAESFISRQLSEMRENLDATQEKLADYRSNTNLVVMDNEAKSLIEQVAKYEEQRVAARLQVAALSDVQRVLKNPNHMAEAYLLGDANDPVLDELGKSLASARQTLTDLQGRFHDTAPDVRNQKAQISAQTRTIRNYVNSRLSRAQENLQTLSEIIEQFQAKLKTVPGAEVGLAEIARESDVYSKLYSQLLERQQQSAILKASTVSKNRVLDRPEPPAVESSPKLVLSFASGVMGLMLGVCIVLFRRFSATTLQSEADVRLAVGRTPVLATVPHRSLLRAPRSDGSEPLESETPEGVSASAEAFRTLRAGLYQSGRLRAGHVILVTSPAPGDGKTLTTLSLAAVLAADDRWVLVIDADLRKPQQAEPELDDGRSLRAILSGRCAWREAVRPVWGHSGEFFMISAGCAAPDELSSERMAQLLMDVGSRYDVILIDGPSFPLVADPLVLAPLADEVISVVRLGHTPRAACEEHVRRLSAVAREYSVVVNDATSAAEQYGYTPQNAARGGAWSRYWARGARSTPPPRALPPGSQ